MGRSARQFLPSKAQHKRRNVSSKEAIASRDSDSEESCESLHPENALQQLKDLLKSDAQTDKHVAKKRRLAADASKNSLSQGLQHVQLPVKESPKAPRPGPSRGSSLASQNGITVPNNKTMEVHFSRKVDDAEMAEMGSQGWSATDSNDFQTAWSHSIWQTTGMPLPQVKDDLAAYGISPKLSSLWREHHQDLQADFVGAQQQCLFALMRTYKDISYSAYPYPDRPDEEDEVLDAALLHSLDHVTATSQRIKRNNDALKADPGMEVPQDQGFTRPKVLLLLPMRNTAYRAVLRLLALAQKENRSDSIQGKARFIGEFGPDEDAEAERQPAQPPDHAVLFSGNTDDHFTLGIKITRGAVKLYADVFQSDIIVASPLALATKQEVHGGASQDMAFLSSIEILVAARCDVFEMQNWAHVVSVFESVNQIPKASRDADMMRVQQFYLDGRAKYYRQNILLTSFTSPSSNALFTSHCSSHAGKARLHVQHQGILAKLPAQQVRQMFERIPVKSPTGEPEQRFAFFKANVWPRIRDSGGTGQLLFVSSYYDYVRLRGMLREEGIDFEALTEYASGSEVARGRSRFAAGRSRLAIYTERAHFYHRRHTRGVRDIFLYQLPQHADFYKELINQLDSSEDPDKSHATMSVLFSKYDALRLERIVGSIRAQRMLANKSGTYLFC